MNAPDVLKVGVFELDALAAARLRVRERDRRDRLLSAVIERQVRLVDEQLHRLRARVVVRADDDERRQVHELLERERHDDLFVVVRGEEEARVLAVTLLHAVAPVLPGRLMAGWDGRMRRRMW